MKGVEISDPQVQNAVKAAEISVKLNRLFVHISVQRSYVAVVLSTMKAAPSLKQNVPLSKSVVEVCANIAC